MKKILPVLCFVLILGWGNVQAAATIDVMVLFSSNAATSIKDKDIVHAIINTNTVFKNSGISTRLRLVHSATVNFHETDFADSDTALIAVQSKTDGIVDEIHALRDSNGADLVILIVDAVNLWNDWTRGDANVLYRNDPALSEYAPFALIDWQGLNTTAFSHEIGHMMGAHHDWYLSAEKKVPYPYARGYVNTQYGWRTIMAYEDECTDHGISCPRIPFFSNPNINYGGVPMGVPVGTNTSCQNGVTASPPCDAYDALAIMNTSPTVAGFRGELWSLLIKPATVSPAAKAVLSTYTPEFSWKHNSLVTQYGLVVGLSPKGSGQAFMGEAKNVLVYQYYKASDICAGDVCKVVPRMSNSDGNHYWSVWANSGSGWSVWTDPVDFTLYSSTMKGAVDVKPLSPASDVTVSNYPIFTWNATASGPGIPDAVDYRILVWNRTTGQTVYSTDWMPANSVCKSGATTCQATPNIALSPGKYLWRIKARGLYGEGSYNTRLYFQVK